LNSRVIGGIGVSFFIVFFLASLFAWNYNESHYVGLYPFGMTITTYPYRGYSFPLLLLSILSLIIGIAGLLSSKTRKDALQN